MLGQHGRGLTRALFTRPALALARIGVTPNLLTFQPYLLEFFLSAYEYKCK